MYEKKKLYVRRLVKSHNSVVNAFFSPFYNPSPVRGLKGVFQYIPCSWESQGISPLGRKSKVGCGLEFAFSPCHLGMREGPLSAFVAKSVETAALG